MSQEDQGETGRFLLANPLTSGVNSGESKGYSGEMTMDDTDKRLISFLRENSRAPTAELGRRLGLSRTTVQGRIERLERQGVILGYTARLSDEMERGAVRAHVMVTVGPKDARSVENALRALPAVRTLHSVSGPYDMLAVVVASSVSEMDEAIDRIGGLPGVDRTMSSIILSTRLDR
jgi:DNA-binding Lrp family transcriptional regulator